MFKVDLNSGDVLISRVQNGWVAQVVSDEDPERILRYVYQEEDEEHPDHALASALQDMFMCSMRSKRRGGLVISYEDSGYEDDE